MREQTCAKANTDLAQSLNSSAQMANAFWENGGVTMMTIVETEVTRSDAKVILVPANSNVHLVIVSNPN